MNNTDWFSHHKSNPDAKLRLFCFPYAGGGPGLFREWSDLLAPEVEVFPVHYPGRESRLMEPGYSNLDTLISRLLPEIEPCLDRPFVFFGYSLGALVAFELTRALRRLQLPEPELLMLAAAGAPHMARKIKPIHALPDDEFIEELRKFNATPEEVLEQKELMKLLLPSLRNDFSILNTYELKEEKKLNVDFSVYTAGEDRLAPLEEVRSWNEYTSGNFNLNIFENDHFFIHAPVTFEKLIQSINTELLDIIMTGSSRKNVG